MTINKIKVVVMVKGDSEVNKVSIDTIDTIITSFDKKHQKIPY